MGVKTASKHRLCLPAPAGQVFLLHINDQDV